MIHNVHADGKPCPHKRCKQRQYIAECDECGALSYPRLGVVELRFALRRQGWKVNEFRDALCPGCWGQQWASRDGPPPGSVQGELFADT